MEAILKRKQLLKITFLVNEQNVSVMYIDISAMSWCLDWNIFQQDEWFCLKLGLEVEHAKSNLKTSLSQIWVICHLLPFVRVGPYISLVFEPLCMHTSSGFFFTLTFQTIVFDLALYVFHYYQNSEQHRSSNLQILWLLKVILLDFLNQISPWH